MPEDSDFRFIGLLGDDSVRFDSSLVTIGGSARLRARVEALPSDIQLQADEAADDSDKVFTVPNGSVWKVLWARYTLAATATVGTRKPRFDVRDSDDNLIFRQSGNDITAGQTGTIQLSPGAPASEYLPPSLYLPGGFDIRVHDLAAIDAAADDLTVYIMTEVFPQ